MKQQLFDQAVEQLYAAIIDDTQWAGVLDTAAKLLEGVGGQYFIWDHRRNAALFNAVSQVITEETVKGYLSHYGAIDPRRIMAAEYFNKTFFCHDHFDEAFAARSEFYQDFLIPSGVRYASGVTTAPVAERGTCFAVFRAPGQAPFDADARNWMSRLRPHIVRSSDLHKHTVNLKLQATVAATALDAFDYPVAVVDEDRKVVMANRAMTDMLRSESLLRVHQGRLVASKAIDDNALLLAVRGAVSPKQGVPRTATTILLAVDGGQHFSCSVLPIRPEAPLAAHWQRPMALVVLGDSRPGSIADTRDLRMLFGFSPAEARVVHGIVSGASLEHIAMQANVSINTVRSQLKSAFHRVGVSRQADLVRLVSNLPRLRS